MSCFPKDESDRSALGHKREHNVEFVSSTENRSISSWKAKSSLENNDGRRKESFQRGMDLRSYFLDERLTPAEKILLAEIDSLTSDDRGEQSLGGRSNLSTAYRNRKKSLPVARSFFSEQKIAGDQENRQANPTLEEISLQFSNLCDEVQEANGLDLLT
jgi:hypothetical protein